MRGFLRASLADKFCKEHSSSKRISNGSQIVDDIEVQHYFIHFWLFTLLFRHESVCLKYDLRSVDLSDTDFWTLRETASASTCIMPPSNCLVRLLLAFFRAHQRTWMMIRPVDWDRLSSLFRIDRLRSISDTWVG